MPDQFDDDEIEHRHSVVRDVFTRIGSRPRTRITWTGETVEVHDDATIDRLTGRLEKMVWVDGSVGDLLNQAIGDPSVTTWALDRHAGRAAARALVAADGHELCEWFQLDGDVVWDPHPNGSRWGTADADVTARFDDDPPSLATSAAAEWVDVPARTARAAAAELCARVTVGPLGEFTTSGDVLVHTAEYFDRVTGDLREFSWSRELLGDLSVPAGGRSGSALRATLLQLMFETAAASLVHEVAEWLTLDGVRLFDPHPATCAQLDVVHPRIVFATSPHVAT